MKKLILILAAAFLLFGIPKGRAETEVDVELVLAVDASNSMKEDEKTLQRDSYVAAIQHPWVLNAIASGKTRRIALIYIEWADEGRQKIVVPWTLIDGPESAARFAATLREAPFMQGIYTSISGGLAFAMRSFENNGFRGLRYVIDISGDGEDNQPPSLVSIRSAALAQDIVVNGLPLVLNSTANGVDIESYYEDCVIGGPSAFIVPVRAQEDFVMAVRLKLVLEIAQSPRSYIVPVNSEPPSDECW